MILAGVVVTLVGGAYVGWKVTFANQRIKTLILESVRPFLAQETSIGNMDVGLNSVHFSDVVIAPKDHSFRLEVEDVSFGYSLINLIKYRFAAHRVPHEAMLVRPHLIIRLQQNTVHADSADRPVDFQAMASELLSVRRITLANASVSVEDSSGRRARLAHALNGWFLAAPSDSAQLRLSGHIFDSPDKNVRVNGRINLLAARPLWLSAEVMASEPADHLPFLLPDYIQVQRGRIQGEIHYDQRSGAGGRLLLEHADFKLANANLFMRDVRLEGVIENNKVNIHGEVADFNGSSLTLEGELASLLNPHFDAVVDMPSLEVNPFMTQLMGSAAPHIEGRVDTEFKLDGTFTSPRIKGRLIGQNFNLYSIPLDYFEASVSYEEGFISFGGTGQQVAGITVMLNGSVDTADDSLRSTLSTRLTGDASRLFPASMLPFVPACNLDWTLAVQGPMARLQGLGEGHLVSHFANGDSLRLYPRLQYLGQNAEVSLRSSGSLSALGKVKGLFSPDLSWEAAVLGLESVIRPLLSESLAGMLENVRISGGFSGSPALWTVTGKGDLPKEAGLATVMDFQLESREGDPHELTLTGNYFGDDGLPLAFDMEADSKDGLITIRRAQFDAFAAFEGALPLGARSQLRGELKLEAFRFEDLHGTFSRLKPYAGRLEGGVRWTGDADENRIHVDFHIREGQFFSPSLYEADVSYLRQSGRFETLDLEFRRDDRVMMTGSVNRTPTDSIQGRFDGESIDWGDLVYALSGKAGAFSGVGTLALEVKGTPARPIIQGDMTSAQGRVGPFNYTSLHFDLADTTALNQPFPMGVLSVRRGRLERNDGLNMLLWGDLVHGGQGQSDLTLLAQGNVLGLLTDASDFIEKAESEGEIFLRWDRTREGWALGSLKFEFDQGQLRLADVAPVVNEISGRGNLMKEGRFLHVESLNASAGGGRLSISNRLDAHRPSLTLSSLGVELGTLVLSTTGKGVRLHLPSLMEEGETGWFGFSGKGDEPGMLLSGPPGQPRLEGRLHIRDLQITYPFLETGKGGEAPNVRFLTALNWDVEMVPGKDVHYIRRVDNPMGNVIVDLQMRENLGGLNFAGVIDHNTFEVWGGLVSTEGTIEVLDNLFRPDRITFEYPRSSESPFISGRGFTTVVDSLGVPSTVWLNITSTDDDTGIEKSGGPWEKVRFRFSTDNPNLGRTEADLMAALGYSTAHFRDRAYMALGMQVENRLFRPIFRPLEKGLRQHLGLDVVHFSSMFGRNILQMNPLAQVQWDPWTLLRSTKFTLGKYFSPGLFITYSGQVHDGYRYQYPIGGLGIRHALILEYTIRPDLFLEMEYMYDTQLLAERREDKRIWLRHVFPF